MSTLHKARAVNGAGSKAVKAATKLRASRVEAGSRAAVPEGCLDKRSAKVREQVRLALDEWRSEHTIEKVREHYAESDPEHYLVDFRTVECWRYMVSCPSISTRLIAYGY